MSVLAEALEAYYELKGVLVKVGIRQDLRLPPSMLGYADGSAGAIAMDIDTDLRVQPRDDTVKLRLDAAPGSYAWEDNDVVVRKGADAMRLYILGDMAMKAVAINPDYRNTAREYFRQADEAVDDALKAIADALNVDSGSIGVEGNPVSTSAVATTVWF